MVKENYRLKELGALEKMKPSITDFILGFVAAGITIALPLLLRMNFLKTPKSEIDRYEAEQRVTEATQRYELYMIVEWAMVILLSTLLDLSADFTLLLLLLGSGFYLVQIYFIHMNRKAIIARFTKIEND